ncbi:MAG: transporter [bacterium]
MKTALRRNAPPACLMAAGLALAALAATASPVQAGEIGHYVPGLPNLRDFFVPPEPGFYGILYNYFYTTGRLNDRNGDEIDSVTIGPGPGATLDVDVDVDLYALTPAVMWVSPWKIFGARYAAVIFPSFANSSIGASLATETGRGVDPETSHFNVGDLFVQPVTLGWALKHWGFTFAYGFYAPTGKYDVEDVTLPAIGTLEVEASDNIGLGFWTHQIQGAAAWYPFGHPGTAVTAALTYEIHHKKEDFDFTPGQNLTLNWGISQYLPLKKDQTLLLEVGPAGYSSWQVTDDSGNDARNADVHDQVHAAGGQLGLTYVPWNAGLTFHALYEFAAEDRFQGQAFGVTIIKKF